MKLSKQILTVTLASSFSFTVLAGSVSETKAESVPYGFLTGPGYELSDSIEGFIGDSDSLSSQELLKNLGATFTTKRYSREYQSLSASDYLKKSSD